VSWDSEALRIPATAYAQTLYASLPYGLQIKDWVVQKLIPIREAGMANSFCEISSVLRIRVSINYWGKQKCIPISLPNCNDFCRVCASVYLDNQTKGEGGQASIQQNAYFIWLVQCCIVVSVS
jgi:hypothetical protein